MHCAVFVLTLRNMCAKTHSKVHFTLNYISSRNVTLVAYIARIS